MKTYPRIASRLYEEPWLMLPLRFSETIHAFEKARHHPDWQAADDPVGPSFIDDDGDIDPLFPQIECCGGIALARVHGITGKGLSTMAMMCGGFDTGLFRQQLKNIADDPSIHTLVIDFDSPGGMAAGNAAVTASIREVAASGKSVIGYASGMCASAAYWMACACDEFHADPDAIIGSISTVCSGVDTSAQWAMQGKELKLFATGKFKATGMDGKPWTADEEANIWERVGQIDSEFKSFVSSRRPITPDCMEGQWWYARFAPTGLCDSTSFDSLQSLIESIVMRRAQSPAGES